MPVDVICIGEALIDLFAPEGLSLEEATTFERAPGGAPANVAAALGKIGVSAGFIGKAGNDPFGALLRKALEGANVDISQFLSTSQAHTSLAWVARPDPQTSEFLFYRQPGADALLEAGDIDAAYIHQGRIFHFGSVSLSMEPARSATLAAVEIARRAGAVISFDPNWRPLLWASQGEALVWIAEGLVRADIVKMNEVELSIISGETDYTRGAHKLLDKGPELAVVTLGERGAYFATRKADGLVPTFPVEVMDTTGCGDAFTGGLLGALLESGRSLTEIDAPGLFNMIRFANAAAALTATHRGVIPALPTRGQIERLLARGHGP